MKNIIYFLLCMGMTLNSFSQAPGNVSGDLVLWVKPSSFTPSLWTDLSISSNNFTQGVTDRQAVIPSSYINYNSVVEFNTGDGQRDYMNGSRILINGQANFSIFAMAFGFANNSDFSPIIEFQRESNARLSIQGRYDNRFAMPSASSPTAFSSSVIGSPSPRATIASVIADGSNITVGMDGIDGTPVANPEIVNHLPGTRIGSANRGPLRAYLGDIIVYDTGLTLANRLKVETYLSIKYGITMGSNYMSTIGATIYDVSSYNNNIIALGRDDNQTLLQKQSHSNDDSTRLYLNTLQITNSLNAGVFSLDTSYVAMGDNDGKMLATIASNVEIPTGYDILSRVEREWKITNTNISETYSIDIKLESTALSASANMANLRILVDDDGNFSNGGTSSYLNGDGTGIVISYSDPAITISNISNTHIPTDSTKYITIASADASIPLPIDLISFKAYLLEDKVQLKWETASETNNDYFTVEKSEDAINWEIINTIAGAGNSSVLLTYSTFDQNPYVGISYYRLKQTDFDGEFIYSETINVNTKELIDLKLNIYPNPTNDKITIEGNKLELENIIIYNIIGQDVTLLTRQVLENEIKLVIDLSELSSGIYYIKTGTTVSKVSKE